MDGFTRSRHSLRDFGRQVADWLQSRAAAAFSSGDSGTAASQSFSARSTVFGLVAFTAFSS